MADSREMADVSLITALRQSRCLNEYQHSYLFKKIIIQVFIENIYKYVELYKQ